MEFKFRNETFFLLAYSVYFISGVLYASFYLRYIGDSLQNAFLVFEFLLLFVKEIKNPKWKRSDIPFAMVCLLLFVLTKAVAQTEVAMLYMFMFSARNVSFKKIAKLSYYYTVILLFLIVFSSTLGLIQDMVFEDYRHSLGFLYVLFGPALFANAVLIDLYLSNGKIELPRALLYTVINILLYVQCDADLSFGLTAIAILFSLVYGRIRSDTAAKSVSYSLCKYALAFFAVMSFLAVWLYSSHSAEGKWIALNGFLSGRLKLSEKAFDKFGVKVFSQEIPWVGNAVDAFGKIQGNEYFYVDNAYIGNLVNYGVLFSVIIWALVIAALWKMQKQKNEVLLFIMMLVSAHFVFDNLKMKIIYNTFWLAIPTVLLQKNHIQRPYSHLIRRDNYERVQRD